MNNMLKIGEIVFMTDPNHCMIDHAIYQSLKTYKRCLCNSGIITVNGVNYHCLPNVITDKSPSIVYADCLVSSHRTVEGAAIAYVSDRFSSKQNI